MEAQLYQADPSGTIILYWWLSLLIGGVVIVAVAGLLYVLARTAEQIEEGAAEIWRVGKLIANNTVHIPVLLHINQTIAQLLNTAGNLAQATERIHQAVVGGSTQEETGS